MALNMTNAMLAIKHRGTGTTEAWSTMAPKVFSGDLSSVVEGDALF